MKYRVEVKQRNGWRQGRNSYPSREEAVAKMNYLISLGHPKTRIRVRPEREDF